MKSLENNALAALTSRAPQHIMGAIKTASAKTGVSFSYLMEKAAAESNFNPTIKAKTSSATGLFQFIESTWMDMINKHGAKHGINMDQSRSDLLNLRKDPQIASLMAAEFADGNAQHLKQTVGGKISNTELYFAHFMGAGGASAFLNQMKKNPMAIAPDLFPKEARANRNVFYDRQTGEPRTLQQVYDFFDKKFSGDAAPATMAHKQEKSSGYNLSAISNDRYTRDDHIQAYTRNSLYEIQNQINSFFTQPISSFFPTSYYGELRSPSSILLDVLR